MKVGQQRIYDTKLVAGKNEQVGLSLPCVYAIAIFCGLFRRILESADGGRTDSNYAAVFGFRTVDRVRGLLRNFVAFAVQFVVFDFLDSYRLKRAQANVQCDFGNLDPEAMDLLQYLRREVQASGRRRYGSSRLGVNGLIAFAVACLVAFWNIVVWIVVCIIGCFFICMIAMNVGRKWDSSDAFDSGKKILYWREPYAALAETAAFDDLGFESVGVAIVGGG